MPISTTTAYAYDSATVSSTAMTMTAIGFSAANIDTADRALISVDTQPVRFRYDGGVPTAAEGHYLESGDTHMIEGNQNIRNLQLIRATGTDGFVAITLETYSTPPAA
jgi:hypothetical protein